jgi:hypothetical protein
VPDGAVQILIVFNDACQVGEAQDRLLKNLLSNIEPGVEAWRIVTQIHDWKIVHVRYAGLDWDIPGI